VPAVVEVRSTSDPSAYAPITTSCAICSLRVSSIVDGVTEMDAGAPRLHDDVRLRAVVFRGRSVRREQQVDPAHPSTGTTQE